MPETHILSKSTFLRGGQCQKSLYLNAFHQDLRDPIDETGQFRMQSGIRVGELARDLFPGGALARPDDTRALLTALECTRDLIEGEAPVIYEAAVRHDGVLAFLDILICKDGGWTLYEVKSTTQVKDDHLWDVALQYHLLEGTGLPVADVCLLHLNREYTRQGDLDLKALFTSVSLLEDVIALQPGVVELIETCKATLASGEIPEIDIGPYCHDPVDCDFIGHCWAHVPEPSVFSVHRLYAKQKFELYYEGITQIEDIPADFKLSASSSFHVEVHKSGQAVIDRGALTDFLDTLEYPLHFLDFETFMLPLPPFDGTWPYMQIPYQYSLHVQDHPEGELRHSGFLAEAGTDPRRTIIERLLAEIEPSGTILVYSLSFERGRLNDLAETFPERTSLLQDMIERLVDLMMPFQKRWYYLPEMHGSYSIKAVLPALVADMSYEGMTIADGNQAMVAYLSLEGETDQTQIDLTREALWEYCKMDTMAMVRILEKLHQECNLD